MIDNRTPLRRPAASTWPRCITLSSQNVFRQPFTAGPHAARRGKLFGICIRKLQPATARKSAPALSLPYDVRIAHKSSVFGYCMNLVQHVKRRIAGIGCWQFLMQSSMTIDLASLDRRNRQQEARFPTRALLDQLKTGETSRTHCAVRRQKSAAVPTPRSAHRDPVHSNK